MKRYFATLFDALFGEPMVSSSVFDARGHEFGRLMREREEAARGELEKVRAAFNAYKADSARIMAERCAERDRYYKRLTSLELLLREALEQTPQD